jgi:transcriptional regulator with XRE-family HTH domain
MEVKTLMTPTEFKAARLRLGLGTPRMARVLGVGHSTILRWQTGQSPVPHDVATRLAAILADPERARAADPDAWADGRVSNAVRARAAKKPRKYCKNA